MAITLLNPDGLPEIDVYRQVAVASGARTVFVAGQVSWDAAGVTVGVGDLAAQVEQCYRNVATALAAAGASFDDVAKLTVHVAGSPGAPAGRGPPPAAPATLLGVAALDVPEHLVEVEAVAVLD
ncbi:RidA family protein [Streptomyces sp. NRRL F-6676]|uniref:RidA family protein n=1 Tax=Streptomyces sp. NRRL F-6676 TaxID=1463878 RepID=UPI00055CD551|nr:RidA family protein [Streptomyces sp. NRRL F-6676]